MSRPEEALGPEPSRFSELHIGAGVLVYAERKYGVEDCGAGCGHYSPTDLDLIYEGYQDDLLAARVITRAMLAPPGKGHHYRDPGGRNVRIARRIVEEDGRFFRYLTVSRRMHIDELHRWPGGAQGLAAVDMWLAWQAAQHQALTGHAPDWAPAQSALLGAPAVPSQPAPSWPGGLRLVVDNTREVTP